MPRTPDGSRLDEGEFQKPDGSDWMHNVCALVDSLSVVRTLIDIEIRGRDGSVVSQEIVEAVAGYPGFERVRILLSSPDGELRCAGSAQTEAAGWLPHHEQNRRDDPNAGHEVSREWADLAAATKAGDQPFSTKPRRPFPLR